MLETFGIKLTASDETRAAFDSVGRNLSNLQTASASVAGALASIGVGVSVGSLVAMVKNINDGVDALNDLKDATGASIENISALEDVARRSGASFDTVGTALVKLNQALSSAKPGSDTERAINAIGLSVKDLKALDPAEAFQKIAVQLSGYADDANKARLTQELFGKSLKEVAPLLKDLAESGKLTATVTTEQAEKAEKLNKQMASLQKNALDLGRAFTAQLVPALADGVERFMLANKHAGGLLETIAMYLRLDYSKNVQGNLAQVEQQIAQLEERGTRITSEGARKGNDKMIADLRAQAAYLKEYRQMRILAEQGDAGDAVSRKYLAPKATVGEFASTPKAKAAAHDSANAFAGEQEAAKEWAKSLEAANKLRDDAIAKSEGLTKAEADLKAYLSSTAAVLNEKTNPAMNQMVKDAYSATIELEKLAAARKAVADAIEAQQGRTASAEAEARAERERTDAIGMTREALADLAATRLEDMATAKERTIIAAQEIDLSGELADSIKKEAQAYRDRAAAIRGGAVKEAAVQSAKDAAAEWQRGWSETDRLAREVFTSWATEGGSAAQKIGDALKKALLSAIYEATLKPVVFQVYASLTGGAGGTAGALSQAASGASRLSSLGGFGSSLGLFGSGFNAGLGAVFGEAGTLGGLSAGTTALGAGNIAGGLGTLAGTALPWIAGAAVLANLMDYKVTPTGNALVANVGTSGASAVASRSDFVQEGGLFGGGTTQNSSWANADTGTFNYIDQSIKNVTAANKAYATAIGLNAEAMAGYTQQLEVNVTGLDAAAAQAAIDAQVVKFQSDMLSSAYGGALDNVAAEGETSAQTLQRLATNLVAVNDVLDTLGGTALAASVDGAKAASGLVDAFGGLNKMGQSVAAYYDKFYTDAEKAARSTATLGEQFAALGMQVPATRQEFRKLVEGIDITTDSGAKLAASVLGLAPAFDAAAQSAAAAANNLLAAAKNWGTSDDVRSIQAQILQRNLADSGLNVDMGTILGATKESVLAYYKTLDPNSAAAQALLKYQQDIYDFVMRGGRGGGAVGNDNSGAGAGYAAADSIASAWQAITDSIWGEVKRIRGLIEGTGPDAFAAAQARFTLATAQARAGDQDAARSLPELSQALLQFAETNARTLAELRLIQGKTAGSLTTTGNLLAEKYRLRIPTFDVGTNLVPQDMLALIHKGEAIVPAPYNPAFAQGGAGAQGQQQAAEIAALREDVRSGQAQIAALMAELVKLNRKWDGEGLPETRTV